MSLNDFLADEATGSWADDVDDLPIAPQSREGRYPGDSARRGGDYLASMPDRVDRDRMAGAGPMATPYGGDRERGPPRQELPLPDKAPFTAYLGSLPYDCTEGDIADFFAPHKAVSVRIVTERDGKPKGFGYIEFETREGLVDAISRSGTSLAGRTVRVSVADPPKSGGDRPGFAPSAAEEASQWRRAGPLPPSSSSHDGPSSRPGMGGRERSMRGSEGGPSGFDNMEVSGGGRSGFGSRFQASPAPREARGPPREPREPLEPSKGEVASDWRTGKPVEGAPARRPGFGHRDNSQEGAGAGPGASSRSPSFRHRDATEVDEKYASQERMGFGSKFVATPPESPSNARRGGAFERRGSGQQGNASRDSANSSAHDSADTWRSARGAGPKAGGAAAAPPLERKKLDLKPRGSGAGASADSAAVTSPSSSKASPFGNAKPVDSSERERAIEERIRKEREQRAAEEAARKEKEKAEREKAVKDAPTGPRADREKAAASGGATTTKARAPAAASEPASADANASADVSGTASPAPTTSTTTTTPATPKSPPPTGAWGGGRAASGALASKQEKTNGDSTSASVSEVTKGVEDVKVSEA